MMRRDRGHGIKSGTTAWQDAERVKFSGELRSAGQTVVMNRILPRPPQRFIDNTWRTYHVGLLFDFAL